jgi:outer membrane protein assembly factor BamD
MRFSVPSGIVDSKGLFIMRNSVFLSSAMRGVAFALCMGVVVPLAACSSGVDEQFAFTEVPADKLYNEGLALMNGGKYKRAADRFGDLEEQHPYSEFAKKGLVLQTYSHYAAGEYDDAIQAGQRYVTLHPGSEDAPYAQYLVSQAYFNQIPDITRDQARTEKAMESLDELLRRYPNSEYAEDARKKLRISRDQIAGKEMEVGRFYLNKRNYIAAVNRFKVVVTEYQTTRHVEEALYRLVEANLALGIVPEAQTAAAVLGHNYPDSEWYKDAYGILSDGGYEPRESRDSWISRTFRGLNPLGT